MLFGSVENKKEKVSLVLDIGNASIGGAFVLSRSGELPKILYNMRLPIGVLEKPDASQLFANTSALLDELVASIVKHGFAGSGKNQIKIKHITDAFVTFSSPWFVSKTKVIHIEQQKAFVITKNFLEDVAAKEENIFETELVASGGSGDDSFEVIEKNIVHTKINGYTLDDSIGKNTNIFDAFLYISVVPKVILEKVRATLLTRAHISKEKTTLHTFPLVSFSVVRDVYPNTSDFVLMDVTGEVTDMSLVQDNVIMKTVSFPSGRNLIIRQIKKSFGISSEIAESTLHIYSADKAEESVSTRMQEALTDAEREWAIYFEDAFTALSEKTILPGTIYMTSDSDVAEIFSDFLKLAKTDATATFRKNLKLTRVDHTTLAALYASDAKNFEDEFIAILTVFFAKQSV